MPTPPFMPPALPQRRGLDQRRAWQRRSSTLARLAVGVYAILIIDASLYPFTDWSDIGVGAFDYLAAPWPQHALQFDLFVNVLGYLPLGVLGIAALYPQVRNARAAAVVVGAAAVLSLGLEALQTFLPARVASKVDLLSNLAGALLGIVIGLRFTEAWLDRGRLRQLRVLWFRRDASRHLVLLLLWFGALLYPERYAIGCGAVVAELASHMAAVAAWQRDVLALWPLAPGWFECADGLVCASYLTAAAMVLASVTQSGAPRVRLLLALFILTMLGKTLGAGLTDAPTEPLIWITPGAIGGFSAASTLSIVLLGASPAQQRRVACAGVLLALAITNFGPDNAYFDIASHSWERGRLLNFYGLALGLTLCWPFAALAVLLARSRAF